MMKKERNKQKKMGKGEERKKCWLRFRSPFVVYLFFFLFRSLVKQSSLWLLMKPKKKKKRGGRKSKKDLHTRD